jgi:hypothetical protein
MEMTEYGFTAPQSEIEKLFNMNAGDLARSGLDMDLADWCRGMHHEGVDLKDETAVRKRIGPQSEISPHYPERWTDAVVLVAKTFQIDETPIDDISLRLYSAIRTAIDSAIMDGIKRHDLDAILQTFVKQVSRPVRPGLPPIGY